MSNLELLNLEQSFQDATFDGLELEAFEFSGKDFYQCTFNRVKLNESLWKRVIFEDCVFDSCDLTRSRFTQTTIRNVAFRRSKLMGIDWSDVAKNPVFSFEECDLRYSSFVGTNLRKTRICDCKALEANFFDCDLVESDFSGTDLDGANFESSDLTRANLVTASGAFVNPIKNRVKDLRVAVESAVLLAMSHGMWVSGYSAESDAHRPATSRRSRKR
jgi:uncharacterized protein YjbI with pentapeptide repeats